jgi:hypothetical protein
MKERPFAAEAIRKELKMKKTALRKAYRSANKDQGQLEAKEWEGTLNDGSHATQPPPLFGEAKST